MSTNGKYRPETARPSRRPSVVVFPEDRLPPQNIEAEQLVIGSVLMDNSVLPDVLSILSARNFWRTDHQIVFGAIEAMHEAGTPIDPLLLDHELERRGLIEQVGETVRECLVATPSPVNARYAAEIVFQLSIKRAAIEEAREVIELGYSPAYSCNDVIERVQNAANTLGVGKETHEEAEVTCLSDVKEESVDWLWPDRFPLGMLSAIIGDPEQGKSFITCGMAATITSGSDWPGLPGTASEPGSVIFLSAEDSLSHMVLPRLKAAGANTDRVFSLRAVKQQNGSKRSFTLARDVPTLDRLLQKRGDVRLVVIDPVNAYLGGIDGHKDADIRGILSPLKEMAEKHHAAVLMIMHMNKSGGSKAIYRGNGTLAFIAAARVAWLAARDPKDKARRILVPVKCNIAATPAGAAYRIEDGVVQWDPTPLEMTADEALAAESEKPKREGGARGPIPAKCREVMELIRTYLAKGPERHGATRQYAEGKGFSVTTFYRALDELKVEKFEDENGKKWLRLPPESMPDEPDGDPDILNFDSGTPF